MRKIAILLMLFVAIFSCKNSNQDKKTDQELKIISLAPSITKDLELLGLSDNIVGATSFCEITKKNKSLIIGSAVEVNMEKILLLKPTIVFVSTLTKPTTVETLKKNGINVHLVQKANGYYGMCDEFIKMAKVVDKEEVANKIVADSKAKLTTIQSKIDTNGAKKRVFFQIGSDPIFTVLPNTFMNDYITLLGCENIASGLKAGTVTREFVLTQNPDIIIITTMGIEGEKEKEIWEKFPNINAVKNHKIVIVDSDKSCSPSVVSFMEILQEIGELIGG